MRRHQINPYKSWWHVVATLTLVLAPFVFFLFFTQISKINQSRLFLDIFISTARIAVAYFVAAVMGWVCAVMFYRGKKATVALPVFDVLQSFPTFAALPLAILVWGPTNFTIISFLVLAIVWPIFFSTVSSLKLVKTDWYEAVQISRLKGLDYLKIFLLPASIPGFMIGTIIGLGEGWEALVATEIIVKVKSGLGSFFEIFSNNTAVTFFGIFGLLLLIFSINKLIWLPLLEWSHHRMEE